METIIAWFAYFSFYPAEKIGDFIIIIIKTETTQDSVCSSLRKVKNFLIE